MRKYIFPLVLSILLFLSVNAYSDTITLNQALESKMINLSITGADKSENTSSYTPSYTGLCIQMSITNMTGKNIKVFLEAGRFLQPDDSTVQRMIVTKNQMISLEKKTSKKTKVYAMCSEMMNHSPDTNTLFSLGKKADGKLLELAQLISKNNFQDNAAQCAIWAMTDNDNVYNICSDNYEETKILRKFVKEAKGPVNTNVDNNAAFRLDEEATGTYVKYGKGMLSGSFEFMLKQNTSLSLTLYNDKGEIAHKCVQNYMFRSGKNTLTYKFTYNHFPIGNYHLKMFDDKGNTLLDKILTFK